MDKTCRKCGDTFPATSEFFWSDKRQADGLRGICIACCWELPCMQRRAKERAAKRNGRPVRAYQRQVHA